LHDISRFEMIQMGDEVLEKIEAGIQRVLADPALKSELAGWTRTVALRVDRDDYTICIENSSMSVVREKARSPDVEIRVDKATFMDIASGKLSFTAAYLRELLSVKGDVRASDITRLQKLL